MKLSPIPANSEKYGELRDPMELPGGRKLEEFVLRLGGLEDEIAKLETPEVKGEQKTASERDTEAETSDTQ